jgi:hypothetical protein
MLTNLTPSSRDQDVIETLEDIAEDVLQVTGFFRNGDNLSIVNSVQNGIARTNCIDCLDRTNAAQFVIGKLALGHQLHALGVIEHASLDYDTDVVNLFTHMYVPSSMFMLYPDSSRFHDHGDTIAIQYGGSHLVNTMETYRKINQWSSHSRDMVESFKRYYNNSFLDSQRQEAYNLFLGNYIFVQGQPMLWDLPTDYYLHHADPKNWLEQHQRNYVQWYDKEHLGERVMPHVPRVKSTSTFEMGHIDDYWLEYYRPLVLSSLGKTFSSRMNSTLRYIPFKSTKDVSYDLSPFRIRDKHEASTSDIQSKKGVKIVDPSEEKEVDTNAGAPAHVSHDRPVTNWLRRNPVQPGILKDSRMNSSPPVPEVVSSSIRAKDKATTQWTLNQFVVNSLNPTVATAEMEEYGRYLSHPLNLPLVVSSEPTSTPSVDFINYVRCAMDGSLADIRARDADIVDHTAFLHVDEEPLTVTEADLPNKRYKAYRQWLKGKSLFKQSRIDP